MKFFGAISVLYLILNLVAPTPIDMANSEQAGVPALPDVVKTEVKNASPLISIWQNRLRRSGESGSPIDFKTLLTVEHAVMSNLVPQGTIHPLYHQMFFEMTDEFLLDSLSNQKLDQTDPKLATNEGVTLKTLSGKDLLFKKDSQGTLTLNGNQVTQQQTLSDGTDVIETNNFLFGLKQRVDEARKQLPPVGPGNK